MQEDPEDFFGDVDHLLAPDAVGAADVHLLDEVEWFLGVGGGWVFEVLKNRPRARDQGRSLRVQCGGEVHEQQGDDDATGAEFRGSLLLLVEEHAEQFGEELGFDFGQTLEREGGSAESLETEQGLMQQCVFVLFAPFHLDDAVQQADHLVHAAALHEQVRPGDRLVAKQDPEFVHLADLHQSRLLHFTKIVDEVAWDCGAVGLGREQAADRCG